MTDTAPDGQPPPADLTARLFRALYDQFDLHAIGGAHVAVPKGTPYFAGSTISEVARQISSSQQPVPDPQRRPASPGQP